MDELKKMWERQKAFQENFYKIESLSIDKKQKWTKEYVLHLISECDELLRETKWKIHRQENKKVSRAHIKEELTDIFKYWLSLAQIWDVSPEEFINDFNNKSEVVEQRYHQEKVVKLLNDENVVAVDIDGVIADYPEGFLQFVEKKTGKTLDRSKLTQYRIYDIFAEDIGEEEMFRLKEEFRATGEKRSLPVVEGAVEGLKKLKELGYTIVLLSARPYKKHPRIFSDTIFWLKANGFVYDAVLWDKNKEERIINEFPKMKFLVEDYHGNANKVAEKGYKVYMFNRLYNINEKTHRNVVRVENWKNILEELK